MVRAVVLGAALGALAACGTAVAQIREVTVAAKPPLNFTDIAKRR